ncbi:MAG: ROK family protein [Traorella sp.]
MKTYIGVDLGGTNVRAAVVDETGKILDMKKTSTEIHLGTAHVMKKIKDLIRSLDDYDSASGIGLGVPGPVDTKEKVMVLASNLPGFEKYPIAQEIEDEFHIPTYIDNDANVAGLGEAIQGAGRGCNPVYYVTISTGIGGAMIVDGKVVSGKHGHAGEIGNLIIDRNRSKINHLNAGAVECEASGTAITRKGQEVFGESIEHAGHVFDLARKNDPQALEIVDHMAYDLAMAFSYIGHIVDPERFVIGGGVMTKAKDVFFKKMEEYYRTMIHPGMQPVSFVEAELEEPGIVGAAMLPRSEGK